MDRVREIFLYFVAALAMFSLLCAVYQAMNDKLWSATTLGSIFLVAALILYIPNLEVLKAWGVEARLRQSLDRAEEIIERLRRLSTLSARVTYLTLAWNNRWGEPSARERMSLLDDIDKQLEEMNVAPQERKAIIRPLIRMVGVDLYNIYVQVLDRYMNSRKNKTPEEMAKWTEWRQRAVGKGPYHDLEGYDFASELEKASPLTWLEPQHHSAANKFKAELIELFVGCERKGGYTPQYAEFYDKYSKVPAGTDLKIKELFGFDVNKPD
jgi:hypothetical protein